MKKSMLYVIAYDIPNNKRRTKVHKALCGFGDWTQFSLFECFLDAKELVKLRAKLDNILNSEEDSVRIYPLCHTCQNRVETIGSAAPKEKVAYIL
jgi:CRISPR-associated protein Cas2